MHVQFWRDILVCEERDRIQRDGVITAEFK